MKEFMNPMKDGNFSKAERKPILTNKEDMQRQKDEQFRIERLKEIESLIEEVKAIKDESFNSKEQRRDLMDKIAYLTEWAGKKMGLKSFRLEPMPDSYHDPKWKTITVLPNGEIFSVTGRRGDSSESRGEFAFEKPEDVKIQIENTIRITESQIREKLELKGQLEDLHNGLFGKDK